MWNPVAEAWCLLNDESAAGHLIVKLLIFVGFLKVFCSKKLKKTKLFALKVSVFALQNLPDLYDLGISSALAEMKKLFHELF